MVSHVMGFISDRFVLQELVHEILRFSGLPLQHHVAHAAKRDEGEVLVVLRLEPSKTTVD